MGKYQDIVNLIENSALEFTSLKVVPRGTPIFPDPLLSGQLRFARKTGANFAVMNPDNQFSLTEPTQVAQQTLNVDQILSWLELGSLITFNQTEMLEVQNWDPTNKAIYVGAPLSASRPTGSVVSLWATPLVIHFDALAGQNQLIIRSRYQVVNGDAISFPTSETLNSLKEIRIKEASYAGQDLDPDFSNIFVLTLEENLPISLLPVENRLYLRAFPSYTSNVQSVPPITSGQMGPFLLDFLGSPLDAIPRYEETFAVRTFDSANQSVEGGINFYKTVQHNHPIANRPIWAENMIFWDMIRGSGGFLSPNRFRMLTSEEKIVDGSDEYSVARVSTKLVPPLPPGVTYQFRVRPSSNGDFRIIPAPYVPVDYLNLPQSVDTVVSFTTPPGGAPLEKLDFIFKTEQAGTEVRISDATLPTDPTVGSFQYTYVFRVLGRTNFQATSIIVKPYFLSLSDLTARYNDGKNYNSGFIYL